jgi:predicted nucleic acid-binding protein
MRIFLDTSLLSDTGLAKRSEELLKQYAAGTQFYVSAVTHFQILWGYLAARMSPENYQTFLSATQSAVVPLTRGDAEEAAKMKPVRADLLDALIASCVKRYDATIWTSDKDFLKFLPKAKVRVL